MTKSRRLRQIEIRLQQSIAHDVQPQAKKFKRTCTSWSFICEALQTCGLVLFYYCFSITLTFYNQRFIHKFRFPLSITMTHLVTKFIMAGIVRWICECCKKKDRIMLPWKPYVTKVAPPGIASSLDIGLSNWSFEFITVTLYTMTKSTVIVFILGFSLLFRLEKPRCSLVFVVLFIALGLLMFTYQSTQFHLFGFLLVLGASFLSGLRWTLSQLVLQKSEIGLSHPLDLMYHIQPWMILALFPLSIAFEGIPLATSIHTFGFHDPVLLIEHLSFLGAGAFIAFGLEFSEFLLLSMTSSITLSISGIIKEIVTLLLAALVNGDKMNLVNGLGLVLCLFGIITHVLSKVMASPTGDSQVQTADTEMLLRNGDAHITDSEEEEVETDEIDIFDRRRDR